MKRKIYITLFGGLGNQLFQYACALSLAKTIDAELIVDDISGFIFDKNFKRKLCLPQNFNIKKAKKIEVLILLLFRYLKKIFFNKKLITKIFHLTILDETKEKKYIKNFDNLFYKSKKIYLIGFFQSEKYFIKNKNFILRKIMQNKIKNINLLNIKKQINKDSLMIGVRMFEEAPKKIRDKFGGLENFSFYNKNIKNLKKKFKNCFVFTTANNNFIKKHIKIKFKTINNNKSYFGNDLENLILMSSFKNFIISNSTYYWWAAYVANYKNKINVKCSRKFTNRDTILKKWS